MPPEQLELDLPVAFHAGDPVRLKGDPERIVGKVLGTRRNQTSICVRWPGSIPDWYYWAELEKVYV